VILARRENERRLLNGRRSTATPQFVNARGSRSRFSR
jgi:hypothetical protein